MAWVQCIACPDLQREVLKVTKGDLVSYKCGWGKFPYMCALAGLEKPSKGIGQAADGCELFDRERCVVCGGREHLTVFAHSLISICLEHSQAWQDLIDSHPEKREYFHPRSRNIFSRWLEVFLEFAAEQKASKA